MTLKGTIFAARCFKKMQEKRTAVKKKVKMSFCSFHHCAAFLSILERTTYKVENCGTTTERGKQQQGEKQKSGGCINRKWLKKKKTHLGKKEGGVKETQTQNLCSRAKKSGKKKNSIHKNSNEKTQ